MYKHVPTKYPQVIKHGNGNPPYMEVLIEKSYMGFPEGHKCRLAPPP